jgi:hypothetical protein
VLKRWDMVIFTLFYSGEINCIHWVEYVMYKNKIGHPFSGAPTHWYHCLMSNFGHWYFTVISWDFLWRPRLSNTPTVYNVHPTACLIKKFRKPLDIGDQYSNVFTEKNDAWCNLLVIFLERKII